MYLLYLFGALLGSRLSSSWVKWLHWSPSPTGFFGAPIQCSVVLGAAIGLLRMVGVFLPELQALSLIDDNFRALLMCLGNWLVMHRVKA